MTSTTQKHMQPTVHMLLLPGEGHILTLKTLLYRHQPQLPFVRHNRSLQRTSGHLSPPKGLRPSIEPRFEVEDLY